MRSGRAPLWLIIAPALAVLAIALAIWVMIGGLTPQPKRYLPVPLEEARSSVQGQAASAFPEFAPPPPTEVSEAEAEDARAQNAAIAFNPTAIQIASPFRFDPRLPSIDRLRARECLAAAVYYEAASEGVVGQRAVAQVVLNRVRHPAFPKTVCDVVFQGSERATGCQFTFTCDGSLARAPSLAGWRRSLAVADAALAGSVDASVGTATHYHTNWVAPYWRTSLTKLTAVGTHIFYRWQGGWGERRAFSGVYRGGEIDRAQQLAMAFDVDAAMRPALPDLVPETGLTGTPRSSTVLPQAAPVAADRSRSPVAADEHGALLADQKAGTLRD